MSQRAYMSFRTIEYGPYTLRVMDGDEPGYAEGVPLLVSLAGPGLPRLRLTANGPQPLGEEDGGPSGLLVFGNFKGDRPALGLPTPEPPLTARMELRLDPELKQWVLEQGGAEFVRRVLRGAKDSQ